jgi:hypothetical protein
LAARATCVEKRSSVLNGSLNIDGGPSSELGSAIGRVVWV